MTSLLVMGGSLTCTGSEDLPTSVRFYYRDSDSGETVDVRMDGFADETETIDVTGSGPESIPCVGNSFTKSGQDLKVDLTEQFPTVLFGPIRGPHRCDQVLRSRGSHTQLLIMQLCRHDDLHWKGRFSQYHSFV